MALTVALAGNPNSGKTTLFNALTGANQYVGNWPGVTVEKKVGKLKGNKDVSVIDLPGIYSLSPYTLEEVVARTYLIDERPHAIINIIDGSNLERNLYLTTQVLELGIPTVVAINMMDVVRKSGDIIDFDSLSKQLGCTVVEISALKSEGIDTLQTAVLKAAEQGRDYVTNTAKANEYYSEDVTTALGAIESKLPKSTPPELRRFFALKFFERDSKIAELLEKEAYARAGRRQEGQEKQSASDESNQAIAALACEVEPIIAATEHAADDDAESIVINERYEHIAQVIERVYTQRRPTSDTISDKIDKVVTNRVLALPIFAVIMFAVYFISVTTVGAFATDWANDGLFGEGWFLSGGGEAYEQVHSDYDRAQQEIEAFTSAATDAGFDPDSDTFIQDATAAGMVTTIDAYDDESGTHESLRVDTAAYQAARALAEPNPNDYGIWIPGVPVLIKGLLTSMGTADWLQALVLDGIVAGVGAVLGFVPQMLVLFLLLAMLEQCGYMSRIAFILDRVFRRFGLSGKSFIPILIGTGCGVPGIMASRTIENQNDRRMTVMTTTFIPCSAKLPVIALFSGAIFGGEWWVAPSAYFLGIATILCSGIILKKTRFFAGDAAPFLMELPAYHLPTVGMVARSTWERVWSFIKRAGTIILLACMTIWFISTYGFTAEGFGMVDDQSQSILAVLGNAIAWIFAPLGFGNWQATSATVTGLIAKENLVSTFAILYAGGEGWYANLQAGFGLAAAYAILAFNLLCAPCVAAMGAIRREMNNRKWFFAAIGYQCAIAWVVGLWVYQFGGLISGEANLGPFTFIAAALAVGFFYLLFRPMKQSYKDTQSKRAVDAA
ncbi:MAG: ferrous iron transporter B [Coriobacteriales bacterium]|jgi:ferrous iron transport protein B|nr:ferrous iron transporter B [Coriobacteriales bacterium]